MRTFLRLFVLVSLVLVALIATANPPTPQLALPSGCTASCTASTGPVTLVATGANPHKSYAVWGFANGNSSPDFEDLMTTQSDGSVTLDSIISSQGSWEFQLYLLDHTDDPFHPKSGPLGTALDVTFN